MDFRAVSKATHMASAAATEAQKRAARAAVASYGDQTVEARAFVYNGYLNLVYRGAPLTESNVLQESAKVARSVRAHYDAQVAKRPARMAS